MPNTIRLGDIIKAARRTDLIITPKLNTWLVSHGDDPLPKDVAELIYEQLVATPRNRAASFSASSAGRCEREQVLGFLGMPTVGAIDPQLQNIFNDGKWRHLRWQAMGFMVPFLTRMEMPLYWRKKRSRGTIDGMGYVDDDHPRTAWRGLEYGFELKGVNPWSYQVAVKQNQSTIEAHKRQVSRYFLMSGFDLFITVYENKATQEWFEWVEVPDQDYIDRERAELERLNDAVETKTLPSMLPQCVLQVGEFRECRFGGPHGPCIKAGGWPRLKNSSANNINNRKKGSG